MKVLLNSFRLNGHTLGFHSWVHKQATQGQLGQQTVHVPREITKKVSFIRMVTNEDFIH